MLLLSMITTTIFSMMFLFLSHPLSFGLILLMQTFFTAMMSGMVNFNFWFSYILFLVMVGGMLILFIYMTSVASNEKFKYSTMLSMFLLLSLITMMIMFFMDPMYFNLSLFNHEMNQELSDNKLSLSKYTNMPNSLILILIISYLLIALIVVVKITNIKYGPLRQKF